MAGLPANLVSLMNSGTLAATSSTKDKGRGSNSSSSATLDLAKAAAAAAAQTAPKDTETPAQKQAAAKMALRKQLEKTLLQVIKVSLLSQSVEAADSTFRSCPM